MKTEIKYDTVTCIICNGSGKIPELRADGNNYLWPTGKNTSCDQCGGRGKVDKPYKLHTLDSDEFKQKMIEHNESNEHVDYRLRNEENMDKETREYLKAYKKRAYPERSYREEMPYHWGRSVESRMY